MKAADRSKAFGAIVGKVLQRCPEANGQNPYSRHAAVLRRANRMTQLATPPTQAAPAPDSRWNDAENPLR
jgi:hypothetical protein